MKRILIIAWTAALAVTSLHAGDKDLPPGLQKKDKLPPGIAKKQGRTSKEAAPAAPGQTNVGAAPAPAPTIPGATAPATPVPSATTPVVATPAKPAVPASAPVVGTPAKTAPAPAPERTTRELRADIDKHVQTVNTLDNKPAARRAGVSAIMKETGATAKAVENLRTQFPDLGTGGLLIAAEIASQTRKPAANFIRQRMDGKPWARIAAEHKVQLDGIDAKLARVESAMRAVK